jgi:hypothetical protein
MFESCRGRQHTGYDMKRLLLILLIFIAPVSASAAICSTNQEQIVLIGDEHSHTLVNLQNVCIHDLTTPGRSVFDPTVEKQLRSLMPGSHVVISLGSADRRMASSPNWKTFFQTVIWLATVADQQRLDWVWLLPPCTLSHSTDWVRSEIANSGIGRIQDWGGCKLQY